MGGALQGEATSGFVRVPRVRKSSLGLRQATGEPASG